MPSNKTFVTIILCLSIIASVWLYAQAPGKSDTVAVNSELNSISGRGYIEENPNQDWRKTLTSVKPTETSFIDLTKSSESFDETSVTAQLSKDFLSQYLILKKNGIEITNKEIEQITSSLLLSQSYTNTSGAVYIPSNLRILDKTDKDTVRRYRDAVNFILKNSSTQISESPVSIVNSALSSENPDILKRIESITLVAKDMISKLLNIEVPKDAVNLHLKLLNSSSNMLFSLESMGQAFDDPIKSLSGVSTYNQNMVDFQESLNDLNAYFTRRLGSAI